MEEERKEQERKYAKLIARVWSDESFKEKLVSDPRTVLAAEGLPVPDGVEVTIVEQTEQRLYLIIPMRPDGITVEEVDIRRAAHASYFSYACQCI
jgi:hypothetical protein